MAKKTNKPKKVLLRTSERTSFKTCRQQWWWSYVENLQSNRVAPALRFGDLCHRALAPYYRPGKKRGPHPARTFEAIYAEVQEQGMSIYGEDGEKFDALELGIDMLEHYIEHWAEDSEWEILWSECPFELDIYNPKGTRYLVTYVGTFDSVFRDHSKRPRQLGLLETKTAASISVLHLGLDEQAGSYWAFAGEWLKTLGILKPGRDIDFILYNFLRKAKRDLRPQNDAGLRLNKNGEISKQQPAEYFKRFRVYRNDRDKENLIQRVRMEAWEMAQVRAGKLPVYKNPRGTFPDQHCNSCGFKDMCELHETSADWEELKKYTTQPWDPYEAQDDTIL